MTLNPHTIRLRGPWHVEPMCRFVRCAGGGFDSQTDDLPRAARQTMPADWSATLGGGFLGRVRYRRSFNLPTGLAPGDKVLLVVEPPRSRGAVYLKEQLLGEVRWGGLPARFEISALLGSQNSLEIVVDHPALDAAGMRQDDDAADGPGGLVGEVRLEIETISEQD